MTKYVFLYEDNNGELKYCGSFIGKNHYKIKFQIYKYLKKLLNKNEIMFGIQEIKKNIFTVYIGKFIEQNYKYIAGTKVKCINRVCGVGGKKAKDFIDKFRGTPVRYEKTHSYREEYDDDISMSESDSELEFDSD
jgi:glutamyl-tRNA reductase